MEDAIKNRTHQRHGPRRPPRRPLPCAPPPRQRPGPPRLPADCYAGARSRPRRLRSDHAPGRTPAAEPLCPGGLPWNRTPRRRRTQRANPAWASLAQASTVLQQPQPTAPQQLVLAARWRTKPSRRRQRQTLQCHPALGTHRTKRTRRCQGHPKAQRRLVPRSTLRDPSTAPYDRVGITMNTAR